MKIILGTRPVLRTLLGLALGLAVLGLFGPAAAGGDGGGALLARPFGAFDGRTMRMDLSHTGGRGNDVLSLDRVVDDGPWAGRRARLTEDLGLGSWRFRVVDAASGRLLFSEGYASVFDEWESTAEAREDTRTFSESLRFPWPKRPARVQVERRDPKNAFRVVRTFNVDPASPEVNQAPPPPSAPVVTLLENGPVEENVDLLFLPEGYSEREIPKFLADARRMMELLLGHEPFKSRRADFNVRALELPSPVPGVHRPLSGIHRRSPLSVRYGIFGSERYVLTTDDRALRNAASGVPYDAIEVLLNDSRYGGGGIYNNQATASVDTAFAEYVLVHEFGHHFAALADEYYTSEVAYETGRKDHPEPWEPNVTAVKDPALLKWRDLVEPGTPVPTPWEKSPFEVQSRAAQDGRKERIAAGATSREIDALFTKQKEVETRLLSSMRWSGKVGAFEGASYEATGLYRPAADCIMFTRDDVGFCPVCRRAISRVIDWRTGRRE